MTTTTDRDDLGTHLAALAEGRFLVPQCVACSRPWWPPRSACPRCQSSDFHWIDMPRELSLFTYTVVHRTPLGDFADLVPFPVGILEDQSGDIQVIGRLDAPPDSFAIGDAFSWSISDGPQGRPVPLWTPVSGQGAAGGGKA